MITLKSVAKSIEPDWDLITWFQWPPNVFTLMSIVLQRTGAYKICLEKNPWWEQNNWHVNVRHDGKLWLKHVNSSLEKKNVSIIFDGYKLLKEYQQQLAKSWDENEVDCIDLNLLRALNDRMAPAATEKDKCLFKFAEAIVSILAITDVCCAGLGLISHEISKKSNENTLFRCIANLLLTTTGSLSTVPKFHGTVLPKMRTPQSGIFVRSLSHHLTFHTTEVEVIWRTFPWLHDHKNSLNVLVVPYPSKVHKTDFDIVNETYHTVRYFKGKIPLSVNTDFLNQLVQAIYEKVSTNNEVDIVVLPEMSLSEKEYNYLLNTLAKTYADFGCDGLEGTNGSTTCLQIPIVVSGVLHSDGYNISEPVHNEVRMAIFFAGKWYDITQRKHHRWQLDRNQIVQYGLETYFPTDRKWFELCSIMQRRLTVLAPNGWLAFTALICEDLARQEPVTEVIRGIGPNLLFALLSDGPQLNTRWSSRYASVLADDPGTAVLSLTSKGMARRSRRPEDVKVAQNAEFVVGLWKDMIRGPKELSISEDEDALLFTISSTYEQEFTLDGRSDGQNSSVFKMDSLHPKKVCWKDKKPQFNIELSGLELEQRLKSDDFGNWHNIRMLSALSYVVDAIIDLFTQKKDDTSITQFLEIVLTLWNKSLVQDSGSIFCVIRKNIANSWAEPRELGTAALVMETKIQEESLKIGSEIIADITNEVIQKRKKPKTNVFDLILDICANKITSVNENTNFLNNTVALAFVYNINTKLSSYHTPEQLNFETDPAMRFSPKDAVNITEKIRGILKSCMPISRKAAD